MQTNAAASRRAQNSGADDRVTRVTFRLVMSFTEL